MTDEHRDEAEMAGSDDGLDESIEEEFTAEELELLQVLKASPIDISAFEWSPASPATFDWPIEAAGSAHATHCLRLQNNGVLNYWFGSAEELIAYVFLMGPTSDGQHFFEPDELKGYIKKLQKFIGSGITPELVDDLIEDRCGDSYIVWAGARADLSTSYQDWPLKVRKDFWSCMQDDAEQDPKLSEQLEHCEKGEILPAWQARFDTWFDEQCWDEG